MEQRDNTIESLLTRVEKLRWARRKKWSVSKEESTTLRFYQGSSAWGSSKFVREKSSNGRW
jgi:hypothetical protein